MSQERWAFHHCPQYIAERIMQPGGYLKPSGPLVRYRGDIPHNFPKQAYDLYTFCFLDSPRPKEWVKNKKAPKLFRGVDSWSTLMSGIFFNSNLTINLLTVLALQLRDDDETYVVEQAELDKELWARCGVPGYPLITVGQSWENYMYSITPLNLYTNSYMLPELLLKNSIASDRLVVVGETSLSSDHPPKYSWKNSRQIERIRQEINI